MKKLKKIISIVIIAISLITSGIIPTNISKAATLPITKANLYSKGEIICLKYKGYINVGVEFVVYKKDGVEYPAYCLNRNKPGVTSAEGYTINVNKLLNNNLIWRAITNGYPFKTPEQLGCKSQIEAFAATKIAVYDMMYNYDWDDFEGMGEEGERVLKAAKSISSKARNSTETKIGANIKIKEENSSWEVDKLNSNYISKTYYVQASAANKEYTVELTKESEQGLAKIVNEENKEQATFKSTEKFKVLLPITMLQQAGEFTIKATSSLETKPILYGEPPNEEVQDYAVVAGYYEEADAQLKQKYTKNITEIEIYKQDGETKEALEGAEFSLLDSNKNVIYTELKSDLNGKIKVENLLPGTYYLKETKAKEGYTMYEDLLEIAIKMNEKYTVTVNNFKEPEEEEIEKPQEENQIEVGEKKEIVKLPRTGF